MPISGQDLIGFLSLILAAGLSNAGGIGGGGLFIPALILILDFYAHEAIPISKLMIFVGSMTSFMLNLRLKHPRRGTISIDYNISIIIIPMCLFGTILGVSLNHVAPSFIILIFLSIVLIVNSFKTIKK